MRVIFNNPDLPKPLTDELAEIARAQILTAFNKSEADAKSAFQRHRQAASPHDSVDMVMERVLSHLTDIVRTGGHAANPQLYPAVKFDQ